jgi:PAS domain S-box-containing protein
VLTFVDIQRLKAAQKDLSRMSMVYMASVDPIFIVDLEDRVIDMNEEVLKTYGLSREQMIGKPITNIVPKERQEQAIEYLRRCRNGEVIPKVEDIFVNKTGAEAPRLLAFRLLTDDQGEPDAIFLTSRRTGE